MVWGSFEILGSMKNERFGIGVEGRILLRARI